MDELAQMPKNRRDFDYHHEKVALTRFGQWLLDQGWSEVLLSVVPASVDIDRPLRGLPVQELDDVFISRFNDERNYRYTFYRDNPGNFDLVAKREGEILIVEGKGQSAKSKRGAVGQIVGALTLERRVDRPTFSYAILIPDGSGWDNALGNHGGLDWLSIYRISESGVVTRGSWELYRRSA